MIIKDHITGIYTVISNKEMNKKDYFLSIIKRSYNIDINISSTNEVNKITNNIKKIYHNKNP